MQPQPKFVCIFGQKQNGKTTFARTLCDQLNYIGGTCSNDRIKSFIVDGFAEPIKRVLCEQMGIPYNTMKLMKGSNATPPGWNKTVRQALELIGQCFREIKSSYAVDKALVLRNLDRTILDDGRCLIEAKASKERGGYNVFMYRPKFINDTPSQFETWCGSIARVIEKYRKVPDRCIMRESEEELRKQVNTYLREHPTDNTPLFDRIIVNDESQHELEVEAGMLATLLRRNYLGTC